jgi:4-alpha-glucanotransferase
MSVFPPGYRGSGLLLHVTSLPSKHGIGDVGPAALAWIDRLRAAGQGCWQALPLGPTGCGNSPYPPLSSFVRLVRGLSRETSRYEREFDTAKSTALQETEVTT